MTIDFRSLSSHHQHVNNFMRMPPNQSETLPTHKAKTAATGEEVLDDDQVAVARHLFLLSEDV